jgi:Cft2 family RNA processing exonuclease
MIQDLGIRTIREPLTPGKTPKKQAIYILSSGMLVEKTPSYAAAAALAGDHRHSFCFVGYCDPATPGGELLATAPGEPFSFKSLDYTTPLNAHVERFDLSGHADRTELVDFARNMDPRAIVLTHGEPAARDWFIDELAETLPKTQVIDPIPGETFSI